MQKNAECEKLQKINGLGSSTNKLQGDNGERRGENLQIKRA